MCGIPRELPLRREPLVKPFNHIVKRMAELFEFGQDVLADFHIGQIIRLNFSVCEAKERSGFSA